MRTSLGRPDAESTEALLADSRVRDRAAGLAPVVTAAEIARMTELADMVHADRAIIRYVRELAEATREVRDRPDAGSPPAGPRLDPGGEDLGHSPRDTATSSPRTSRPSPVPSWVTGC